MKEGDVDEGDSYGCQEFGGTVEKVNEDGTFEVRVESHAIGAGARHGSLRHVDPEQVLEVVIDDSWKRL